MSLIEQILIATFLAHGASAKAVPAQTGAGPQQTERVANPRIVPLLAPPAVAMIRVRCPQHDVGSTAGTICQSEDVAVSRHQRNRSGHIRTTGQLLQQQGLEIGKSPAGTTGTLDTDGEEARSSSVANSNEKTVSGDVYSDGRECKPTHCLAVRRSPDEQGGDRAEEGDQRDSDARDERQYPRRILVIALNLLLLAVNIATLMLVGLRWGRCATRLSIAACAALALWWFHILQIAWNAR